QEIRVAGQYPPAAFPPETGQRMPGEVQGGRAVGRRRGDLQACPHESPVADDADLLDVTGAVECGSRVSGLRARRRLELALAHRRLARDEEDDVVGHQVEHAVDVASARRRHPGADELADLYFIRCHVVVLRSIQSWADVVVRRPTYHRPRRRLPPGAI